MTAAPDPRIGPLAAFYEDGSLTESEELGFATRAIALVDAADRAAVPGVIRVRTDDATATLIGRLIREFDVGEDDLDELSTSGLEQYVSYGHTVLEALAAHSL